MRILRHVALKITQVRGINLLQGVQKFSMAPGVAGQKRIKSLAGVDLQGRSFPQFHDLIGRNITEVLSRILTSSSYANESLKRARPHQEISFILHLQPGAVRPKYQKHSLPAANILVGLYQKCCHHNRPKQTHQCNGDNEASFARICW